MSALKILVWLRLYSDSDPGVLLEWGLCYTTLLTPDVEMNYGHMQMGL